MIWVEIHCDAKVDGLDPGDSLQHLCHTHRNDNINGAVGNRLQDLSLALQDLTRFAQKSGWVKSNGKWCCPGCKMHGGLKKINSMTRGR